MKKKFDQIQSELKFVAILEACVTFDGPSYDCLQTIGYQIQLDVEYDRK